MYGTLRDLERSLEDASGHADDKQVTIDQLVASFLRNRLLRTGLPLILVNHRL